jgi:ketosteroid isomerase-like protein
METTSSHRHLIQQLVECWASGQLNPIEELLTPNFVRHGDYIGGQKEFRGPAEYKRIVTEFRKLLTEFHTETRDVIEQGDKIAFRFHTSGKHNGKPIALEGVNILRFEGGRIAEDWIYYDATGLAIKLGQERAAA